MTEGFGQLTVGQLRESGVQPLVHRTDRFDNASRKSRAPTLTGCDRSFCLTLRWREMDSNLWYRNAKARDFRSIPGIAGGFHLGGCRQDLSPTLGSADCPILGSGLPGRHRRRPGPASQELTTATASDPDKQDAALPVSPDPIP